jgi:hypothetical protein
MVVLAAVVVVLGGCSRAAVAPTPGHPQSGVASWYGPGFHGQPTSSGAIYDQHALTAAHQKLPLGTRARVTNLDNGKSVEVLVNDRGPFAKDASSTCRMPPRARSAWSDPAPRACASTSWRGRRTARRTSRTACKWARSARKRRPRAALPPCPAI